MKRLFQPRAIFDGPPIDGGMIDVHPTFFHEFLDVAGAQRVRDIPAHPHENDLWGEMGSLKTDCHRRSPSSITVGHRGRSYYKSTQMKICDKTVFFARRGQGDITKFRSALKTGASSMEVTIQQYGDKAPVHASENRDQSRRSNCTHSNLREYKWN